MQQFQSIAKIFNVAFLIIKFILHQPFLCFTLKPCSNKIKNTQILKLFHDHESWGPWLFTVWRSQIHFTPFIKNFNLKKVWFHTSNYYSKIAFVSYSLNQKKDGQYWTKTGLHPVRFLVHPWSWSRSKNLVWSIPCVFVKLHF